MESLLALGTAFIASLMAMQLLLRSRLSDRLLDQPNARSLHQVAVPRHGGLAIMAGMLMVWLLNWQPWMWPMTLCVLLLVALSFVDDVRHLPAGWRLMAHFLIAAVFVFGAQFSGWHVGGMSLMLVAMVWMTNLYNFMDGSDGLAGGMALSGFGFLGVAGLLAGDAQMATLALAVAGGAAAFLLFNFHPAHVFMGDAGSIPLGFLAAAMGVIGWQRGDWSVWFPVMVFSPFILDASVTLLKRLLRRKKVWQAHREHYYQRLVQMGWGHRKTALWAYGIMLLAGCSALVLLYQPWPVQKMGLMAWLVIYGGVMARIDAMWKRAGTCVS